MNRIYEDTIICPYCDYKFTDIWMYELYEEDKECEIECDCGGKFIASVNISYSYNSIKVVCGDKREECDYELSTKYSENPYIYKYDGDPLFMKKDKPRNFCVWVCKKCENEKVKVGPVAEDGTPYIIPVGKDND
jgi:hypothetical protein